MGERRSSYTTLLSKHLSYMLRHAPWEFELEPDDRGWVSLEQVVRALRLDSRFLDLKAQNILEWIGTSDTPRFEAQGGRIRARYGHSFPGKLRLRERNPPEVLFHGTNEAKLPSIRRNGLQPMGRQFVHLSSDEQIARRVGSRKGPGVIVLQILAGEAHDAGLPFYYGNEQVWLADKVPPDWIRFPRS
jgi:putative RNA 2'-phosphotransferase